MKIETKISSRWFCTIWDHRTTLYGCICTENITPSSWTAVFAPLRSVMVSKFEVFKYCSWCEVYYFLLGHWYARNDSWCVVFLEILSNTRYFFILEWYTTLLYNSIDGNKKIVFGHRLILDEFFLNGIFIFLSKGCTNIMQYTQFLLFLHKAV